MVLGPTRAGASRRSLQESGLGRSIPRSATWNRLVSSFPKNTKVDLGISDQDHSDFAFQRFFLAADYLKRAMMMVIKKMYVTFLLIFFDPTSFVGKNIWQVGKLF